MQAGGTEQEGWVRVATLEDLPVGKPTRVEVGEAGVLLLRTEDRVFAASDRCTHQGTPLHKGVVRISSSLVTVSCPLHGSTFRLEDGRILRGPAITRLPIHEVRVTDGTVEVRLRQGR